MTQPFNRTELPKTQSRLKWQAKIRVGLDLEYILGLTPDVADGVVNFSQVVTNNLKDIGSIESLEITQSRALVERYGFGANTSQPFEVAPTQLKVVLKLSKVILHNLSEAENIFNFYPANLLFQQLPFVIQVTQPQIMGGNGVPTSPAITHFFLGCWFAESTVRLSVTDKEDQRLIQSATVLCSHMLTHDGTNASLTGVNALQATFGGLLAIGGAQAILDDMELT